jgi:hypothetical protein
MGFILGFISGVIVTLVAMPFIIKWYIKNKLKDLTGGLLG